MKNAIERAVLEMSEPVAEKLGVYIVDISSKKENGQRYLRIFIDREGGVGLDDCEAFSRLAEQILDENDPIAEAYILEVSSPGADRKLVTEREFRYYIGRQVDVKLYKAVNGIKEFDGILSDFNDDVAVIKTDGAEYRIKKEEAVYIRLHFEF